MQMHYFFCYQNHLIVYGAFRLVERIYNTLMDVFSDNFLPKGLT